jgi:glycosyltransferase involved in cell wall biosynthesis/GT2 family glycosyltransferase
MSPVLSTVLVAWNSADSLAGSLEALRRSAAAAGTAIELVVVDNASADDSMAVAQRCGADVVVANPLNAGYVVAASQGIALSHGDWVMLANPDLTVSEGFVGAMLEAMRTSDPSVACLVPDIRYAADPAIVNSRGIEVDVLGIPAERDAGRRAVELTGPVDVFGPSSSGCLIRRDALAAIGGLEPLYFAYLEDVDVGWRLRKQGYAALVVPDAIAIHEGSASTGEGSWLKAFLVARNRRSLFRLHGPRSIPVRLLRTLTDLGHAAVQAVGGSGTASARGRFAALGTRRYTRFLRASNRRIGIRDDARVTLVPRQTLDEALRRKRSAATLMRREGELGAPPPTRLPVWHARGRMPLRVLVDATNLKPGQGGIRTYTIGLIQGLSAQPDVSLVVAASVEDVAAVGPMKLVRVPARTRGVISRALWRERNLASLVRAEQVDVVLTPVPELPLRKLPVPTVIVVHDVGPLVAPAFYSFSKRLRYRAVLPRTCRNATSVVCVSHTTLLGLHSATGLDTEGCQVIGEGPQLFGEGVPARVETGDEPFFLYVGSLEPRKNINTLVDAFAEADPPLPARLFIVGPEDTRAAAALSDRLGARPHGDRVQHLGFVDPERLTTLYRNATALVLPSLYEGFGLPVLEAMEAGTAVVASDIPSLREVGDDAAQYVSRPFDAACWRDELTLVANDAGLREALVRRGRENARRFTWSHVGEQFSRLLHDAAGSATTTPDARSTALSTERELERNDRVRVAVGADPGHNE